MRKRCVQHYKNYRDFEWIFDDESYFTLEHSSINGNGNFYSKDISLTPPSVKHRPTVKYPDRISVWIVILSNKCHNHTSESLLRKLNSKETYRKALPIRQGLVPK